MKWPVMVSRWSAVRQRYANTDDGGEATGRSPALLGLDGSETRPYTGFSGWT